MARTSATAVAALLVFGFAAQRATPAPAPNPIQAENGLRGTTSWQRESGGPEVYASEISASPGDDVRLHVSAEGRYRILVYRLGWYGGAGARELACRPGCSSDEAGHVQPSASGTNPQHAVWPVTDVLHTGADWVSGYYLVEAVATSGPENGRTGTTFFVLRAPASAPASSILVQVPVNTWEAYNQWGGKSLYDMPTTSRARAVSFDRPFGALAQSPMWWEIQLVRFLEREGYDVSYQTDLDTDRHGASLLQHRLVVVAGHDEYWTEAIRVAFDTALARGTNLAFMGSNDGYWQVRYEDGGRTIFSYKSLYDPDPVLREKTAMFRQIGRPECMLMAVQHTWFARLDHELDYTVTPVAAADPWLAGTGLRAGDTIAGVVSREHDKINPYPASCFKPGLVDLFHYDGRGVDQDGDASRYTAPSGARVFSSGTDRFSWALDGYRSDGSLFPEPPVSPWRGVPVDPRVEEFMRNALDDLTRPAPPAGLRAVIAGGKIRVLIQSPVDPRVAGFVAAIRFGNGGWHRLCHGTTACSTRLPVGRGPIRIGAVALDQWHRHSAGAFALPVEHGRR